MVNHPKQRKTFKVYDQVNSKLGYIKNLYFREVKNLEIFYEAYPDMYLVFC